MTEDQRWLNLFHAEPQYKPNRGLENEDRKVKRMNCYTSSLLIAISVKDMVAIIG